MSKEKMAYCSDCAAKLHVAVTEPNELSDLRNNKSGDEKVQMFCYTETEHSFRCGLMSASGVVTLFVCLPGYLSSSFKTVRERGESELDFWMKEKLIFKIYVH